MDVPRGTTLRRALAALVTATAVTGAACADNTSSAPATASTTPSQSATSSSPPPHPGLTVNSWAKSMCQALGFAFLQVGTPPEPDFAHPAATRQALSTYLSNAASATQQAIDLLSSIGAPPVSDGQRMMDQMRTRLTQLHGNLKEMATRLNAADADDGAAIGQAFGAMGNVVSLFGTLTSDPQLRTAIDQTPECHLPSH
jgi:type IV pilus biogenesis protein CpaD/CtpE